MLSSNPAVTILSFYVPLTYFPFSFSMACFKMGLLCRFMFSERIIVYIPLAIVIWRLLLFAYFCSPFFCSFLCGFKFMFKFVMGVAAKSILSRVESLMEDVIGAMQNVSGTLSPINDEDFGDELNEQAPSNAKVAYLLIFVQSLLFSYQFG